MAWIAGAGMTPFGRHPREDSMSLMSRAATLALDDAGMERRDVDGLLCGYSTTHPHLMLGTAFAEHFGLLPTYAHGLQVGGATGLAMLMLANELVNAGVVRNVLVVAGENRLSGQSSQDTLRSLAQVGHPRYEVPLGPTIPAYYALVASRYMHHFGVTALDLAALAVAMRVNAREHPGAHLTAEIDEAQVMASRAIATPLKLLDCCPVSDGGAAFVVSRDRPYGPAVRVAACGQAHMHQHLSSAPDITAFGASASHARARARCTFDLEDVRYLAVYDSFTITLAILLEELGIAPRGQAGQMARDGRFGSLGDMPMNTHGGLLSYGHSGCAGSIAHLVETHQQMTDRAGARQVRDASIALLHGDGGVLSSHVTAYLERVT
jgi:acetyl-CoA acetyltransferase